MEEILRNQRKIIKYIEEDNNKWDILKKNNSVHKWNNKKN
jgi:hypothetical protein